MKKNTPSYRVLSMPLLAFVFACSKDELGFAKSFTSDVIDNQNPTPGSVDAPEQSNSLTSSDDISSVSVNVDSSSKKVAATIDWKDGSSSTVFNMSGSHSELSTPPQPAPKSAIFNLDQSGYELIIHGGGFDHGTLLSKVENTGLIAIYWNVDDLKGTSQEPDNHLKIYGLKTSHYFGQDLPKFYKLADAKNDKYDMFFGAPNSNIDVIYILWDVVNYKGKSRTIQLNELARPDGLDNSDNKDVRFLTVYAAAKDDGLSAALNVTNAGVAFKFFKVDGHGSYEMINILPNANRDNPTDARSPSKGGIYIVWNVADRAAKSELINFASLTNADKVLAISGAGGGDKIGRKHPVFLDLDINSGADKHDMVIRADTFQKETGIPANKVIAADAGAIYILWNVSDYAGETKIISLSNLGDTINPVTSGSLAIYGARANDKIGNNAPEFLQIGGKDGYDVVIRSELVDKDNNGAVTNEGAIYILWDVADYALQTKAIDLLTPADATSGLLTIYGKSDQGLGSDTNDILYNNDGELTNIDKDAAGTKDIAFNDKDYTYILFGDKIADKGNDDKVDSKTIDLGAIETLLTANAAGFFAYNANGTIVDSTSTADRVGYRFKDRSANLQTVQSIYDGVNPLSDTDSDLGVWDIA